MQIKRAEKQMKKEETEKYRVKVCDLAVAHRKYSMYACQERTQKKINPHPHVDVNSSIQRHS